MNRGLHTLIACPGFTSSDIRKNARIADGTKQINSPGDETRMDRAQDVARDILQAIRDRKDFIAYQQASAKKSTGSINFSQQFLERKIHDAISKEPNSPIKH